MIRKAILIAGGDDPEIGAETDVRRFRHFLTSKIGGAWRDDGEEIELLINPTRQELVAPLLSAEDVDYALVLYSGHGSHPSYSLDPMFTKLALAGDDEMRARELNPHNGKALVIVDTCRRFSDVPGPIREFLIENTRVAAKTPSRDAYRVFFDNAIKVCPNQVTYLFSCSIHQYSYGNRTHGGLYSRTLISTAINWEGAQGSPDTFLPIGNANELARQRVIHAATPTKQHPQIIRSISLGRHLPFCIQL